jgi:hypothetical protein
MSYAVRARQGSLLCPPSFVTLGPWKGGEEGEVDRLRLPYRTLLAEQGFVLLHCHVTKLELEDVAGVRTLQARCQGRGWIRLPRLPGRYV